MVVDRIVGTYLQDDKLLDGNYYDFKMYEILRGDYLLHINKSIKQ
jgi:hypothetical protein